MDNMIIGYEAKRIVRNATGLGNYARTLVNDISALVPAGVTLNLYAPDEGKPELREQITKRSNVRLIYPEGLFSRVQRDWWREKGVAKYVKRDGVKLFHGLSGSIPWGLDRSAVKTVATVHDTIYMVHPEWFSWIDAKICAWKFLHTCRVADRIIAISECTKKDIMRFGDVPASKIDVIYQSCSTRFKNRESESKLSEVRARYALPERYVVCVGTIEERKNVLLVVKAMRLIPADIHLVIVGKSTAYTEKVKRYIKKNQLDDRVHIFHDVSYDDLPSFYQLAEAAAYPSRYEGFGIPIIEAIQSGLPVVACTGSCLEEAGGKDTLYVSPDDSAGMAGAIKLVLKGAPGRDERIANSMRYVTRFEGNNVAQQVLDVYDKVLNDVK